MWHSASNNWRQNESRLFDSISEYTVYIPHMAQLHLSVFLRGIYTFYFCRIQQNRGEIQSSKRIWEAFLVPQCSHCSLWFKWSHFINEERQNDGCLWKIWVSSDEEALWPKYSTTSAEVNWIKLKPTTYKIIEPCFTKIPPTGLDVSAGGSSGGRSVESAVKLYSYEETLMEHACTLNTINKRVY